jgi:hypothetical protein
VSLVHLSPAFQILFPLFWRFSQCEKPGTRILTSFSIVGGCTHEPIGLFVESNPHFLMKS